MGITIEQAHCSIEPEYRPQPCDYRLLGGAVCGQPAKHLTWQGQSERRHCSHHFGVYCAGQGLATLKPVEIEASNHLATWLYIGARLIDAAYCDAHEQDAVEAMAILQRPTTSQRTRELFYTAAGMWSAWRAFCETEEEVVV